MWEKSFFQFYETKCFRKKGQCTLYKVDAVDESNFELCNFHHHDFCSIEDAIRFNLMFNVIFQNELQVVRFGIVGNECVSFVFLYYFFPLFLAVFFRRDFFFGKNNLAKFFNRFKVGIISFKVLAIHPIDNVVSTFLGCLKSKNMYWVVLVWQA